MLKEKNLIVCVFFFFLPLKLNERLTFLYLLIDLFIYIFSG